MLIESTTLTAQELEKHCPDLVSQLKSEGTASVQITKEIVAQKAPEVFNAIKAEGEASAKPAIDENALKDSNKTALETDRKRVNAILELTPNGQEALAKAAISSGESEGEFAIKVLGKGKEVGSLALGRFSKPEEEAAKIKPSETPADGATTESAKAEQLAKNMQEAGVIRRKPNH